MIRVTVELVPGGVGKPKLLGTAVISNRGGLEGHRVGNYEVMFWERRRGKALRSVQVEGFPRLRLTAWDLLYRALREAFGERNQP